jgi:hypothetical protein
MANFENLCFVILAEPEPQRAVALLNAETVTCCSSGSGTGVELGFKVQNGTNLKVTQIT